MRRGPKPGKAKVGAKPTGARKSRKDDGPRVRNLEKRLAEAQEQQAATAEILRVISSSPTDVQPVFDAIAHSASRLCGGVAAIVTRFDGDTIHLVAHHNPRPGIEPVTARLYPRRPGRDTTTGRAILECSIVHIPDAEKDPDLAANLARDVRAGSFLAVPMLRDGRPIGAISVSRAETGAFPAGQVELLKTFADQAVIAIENVRLFKELEARNRDLTEALEQQTATSEILRAISSSPADIQPVFAAVVASAALLCDAFDATIFQVDGDLLRLVAHEGPIPSHRITQGPRLVRGSRLGRAVLDRQTVHVADAQAETDEYPEGIAEARRFGHRTALVVPLLRADQAIGAIAIRRTEVRPFSGRQITLLKTFADQAVIAIENVRLFRELESKNKDLTTALDQQMATSEILRAMSSSLTDVQPVFDTIVQSGLRLLGGYSATMMLLRDDDRLDLVAYTSTSAEADSSLVDAFPMPLGRIPPGERAIHERRAHAVEDVESAQDATDVMRETGRKRGWRSNLFVPMIRDDVALGLISITRREPGSFPADQIALLEIFAAQAVIAIENVRLFNETKEALERQTATSEILRVIASSPTDLQPVFTAIAESAKRLLGGFSGSITRLIDDALHLGALTSTNPAGDDAARAMFPVPLNSAGLHSHAARTRAPFFVVDMQTDVSLSDARLQVMARARGWRSFLAVPMLQGNLVLGTIGVSRREPGGFKEEEIELLKTFADQAVIAIENTRLFNETKEALERQTATSEILRVISSSPTDVQPVLDAVVESAVRLCDAYDARIWRLEGDRMVRAAGSGPLMREDGRTWLPLDAGIPSTQAFLERRTVQTDDVTASGIGSVVDVARRLGIRAVLATPLMREGQPIGVLTVRRREGGFFSDKHVDLLRTFADQAVIAIENVRLFKELEEKNRALTEAHAQVSEALEQQTATSEILRVISRSQTDIQPVFDTIVANAVNLCGARFGALFRFDGELLHLVAHHHYVPAVLEVLKRTYPRPPHADQVSGRTILTRAVVQVEDMLTDSTHLQETATVGGWRSILGVPMLRDGMPIGAIVITRAETGRFADGQIGLLQTFADQAVIAIENVRLFKELETANRELAAASQHKSEFLANMSHELRTPLNAIIGFSEVLSERMFGELNEKQDEYLKDINASGTHLLSLINDILDLSKIEAGRMELDLTNFDLPQAIDNALILIRERAARRGIALHHSVDERLGEIRGDERKIKQVLLNLLSNALKFTPEGGRVEVSASLVDDMTEVSVTDTGVGIAPEDQGAIFEEFQQVGTTEKKAEGTGLGLTLCRKFVELHGGKIWVTSQVGVGSTFTITIPVRPGE